MIGLGKLRSWNRKVIDILYPPTCPVCGQVMEQEGLICPGCREKLHYIEEPRCRKCGKSLLRGEQHLCGDCGRKSHVFTQGVAVFSYDEAMRQSIYQFKYKNKREYATFYGREMAEYFKQQLAWWDAQWVVPVPLYRKKQQRRGYNQSGLIARELAICLDLKYCPGCLKRIRATTAQKELDPAQRVQNIRGAFAVTEGFAGKLPQRILLVDDIYTTGSTVDECARMLLQAGCQEVYVITLSIGAGN